MPGFKSSRSSAGRGATPRPTFPPTYAPDELRYAVRHDLFVRPAQTTLTFRNNASQTALPIRTWGSFLLPNGVGGARRALERGDLALPADRLRAENASDPALRREIPARGHDDPGLGRHLRRARAAFRHVRISVRHLGHRRQPQGTDAAGRQSVRGTALASLSDAGAEAALWSDAVGRGGERDGLSARSRNPPAICRRPTPTRSASPSARAPIAASASGSAAATTRRRARRRRSCRC